MYTKRDNHLLINKEEEQEETKKRYLSLKQIVWLFLKPKATFVQQSNAL